MNVFAGAQEWRAQYIEAEARECFLVSKNNIGSRRVWQDAQAGRAHTSCRCLDGVARASYGPAFSELSWRRSCRGFHSAALAILIHQPCDLTTRCRRRCSPARRAQGQVG
jgi:hypothetical protein